MELTREQIEERLSSPDNLANKLKIFRQSKKTSFDLETSSLSVLSQKGSPLPRLPKVAVNEIKEKAISGMMTQKEIANEYGISQAAVSYQKREEEKELSEIEVLKARETRERAVDKMMLALGLITEEKLEKLKATQLSQVVKEVGMGYRALVPLADKDNKSAVNLIVYSPEIKREEAFKVIEIRSDKDSGNI